MSRKESKMSGRRSARRFALSLKLSAFDNRGDCRHSQMIETQRKGLKA